MSCKNTNEHLVDFLYQGLDADQATRLEGHLEDCEVCAKDIADFEMIRHLMLELPELEPPTEVSDALIKEAIKAVQPEPSNIWQKLRSGLRFLVLHPATATVVVLVLVAGISFYFHQRKASFSDRLEPMEAPPAAQLEDPTATMLSKSPKREPIGEDQRLGSHNQGLLEKKEVSRSQKSTLKDENTPSTRRPSYVGDKKRVRRPRRIAKRLMIKRPPRERTVRTRRARARPGGKNESNMDRFEGGVASAPKVKPVITTRSKQGHPKRDRESTETLLTRAHTAFKKGRCEQALGYYNRILAMNPKLYKKIAARIDACARKLADKGEAYLIAAQKQNRFLSKALGRELLRIRRVRTKAVQQKADSKQLKKESPAPTAK